MNKLASAAVVTTLRSAFPTGTAAAYSRYGENVSPGSNNHLLVLATNEEGYRNLIRITSEASLHGFYRKPRVSKTYLAEHAEGLIGFSGCLSGELCEALLGEGKYKNLRGDENYTAAKSVAAQYQDIFGRGNFYLEIQDQGLEQEKKIHESLFRLERELDIPLVATNDSHYLCGEDSKAHDVMLCVQTGAKVHDAERFRFDSDQFFVKSADEMAAIFPDSPSVLQRTMEIAERCNFQRNPVDNPFPEFAVPPGHTIDSYFEEVCREGLRKRLETSVRQVAHAAAHFDGQNPFGNQFARAMADDADAQETLGFGVNNQFGQAVGAVEGLGASRGAPRGIWRFRR